MSQERIKGAFAWYADDKGYGLIRGDDGKEYFAHEKNQADDLNPREGTRVTFLSRPRTKGRDGMEGYDIWRAEERRSPAVPPPERTTYSQPQLKAPPPPPAAVPASPPVSRKEPAPDIQQAAQEALRLRRLRQLGHLPEPVNDLPPGERVVHPTRGAGTVHLSSRDTISVRFDNDPRVTVDLPRDGSLRPASVAPVVAGPPEAPRKTPAKPVLSSLFGSAMNIGDYVRRMASDVKERLADEGLDASGIYRYEEPEKASTDPMPLSIDPRVARAFQSVSQITAFYSHQVQARQALLAGRHIVICTPTASGKTEAYNPTILEALLQDSQATALYVFPLVALGFDQTERLNKLNETLPVEDRLIIGISNSSVATEEKRALLQRHNQILVTTPESLHYRFLPKPYPNWQKFFQNLRYVVLDEAHVYRGVLGANMANIVRRLLVRCRRLGNPDFPQIIVSSATVRHPAQLAEQLTGLPADQFEVVDRSGSPRAGRHFLVTRSDIHELDEVCADLLEVRTVDGRTGEKRPVRTIVFLNSINDVKRSTEKVREHLRKTGRAHLVNSIEEYYADKGDKNDVLRRLKNGELQCVFATTALMAGIDIGGLDAAIVKHFPGLVTDARQMFGRAGRVGEGAVIFIANRTDPFDQFYFERSERLFQGPTEDVVANPENPYLLAAHLKCAAQTGDAQYKNHEGPLSGRWVSLFGTMGADLLDLLVQQGSLRIRGGNYYLDDGAPHDEEPLNNIRAMESETYVLTNVADGAKLEEKRKATAYRDAHPEAIVWCNGSKYRVLELDDKARQIRCKQEPNSDLRTQGVEELDVKILSVDSTTELTSTGRTLGPLLLYNGRVEITTSVPKYLMYRVQTVMQCRSRRCKHETPKLETQRCPACGGPVRAKQTEKWIANCDVVHDPPLTLTLTTRASWLDFPAEVRDEFDREFWPRWSASDEPQTSPDVVPSFRYAIHSLEHALLKAFPERIRCDRDEIGGVHLMDIGNLAARLYVYDNFPGGLGLVDDFAQEPLPIFEGALDVIERCTCDDEEGCPVCLARYGCRDFNRMLSKLGGRYMLRLLTGQDPAPVIRDLNDYVRAFIDPDCVVPRPTQREAKHG